MYSIYIDEKNRTYFVKKKNNSSYAIYKQNCTSLKVMKYLGFYETMDEAQEALDDYADRSALLWYQEMRV